jgi:5-methylcytosine-specific restriction endonuclease McrA
VEPITYPAQEPDQVKLIARRRDHAICQHCHQADQPVQVHHLIPKHQGGTDDLDNLITLCERCHRQIHRRFTVEQLS